MRTKAFKNISKWMYEFVQRQMQCLKHGMFTVVLLSVGNSGRQVLSPPYHPHSQEKPTACRVISCKKLAIKLTNNTISRYTSVQPSVCTLIRSVLVWQVPCINHGQQIFDLSLTVLHLKKKKHKYITLI